MPLIVFHTRRVRDALKRQEGIGADVFFLSLVAAVVCGLVIVSHQAQAPFEQHLVINGASQLFVDILGEAGWHARSAIGMAQLPLAACVEVEAVVKLK